MSDEKDKILKMIEQRTISAAEGLELLNALEEIDTIKGTPESGATNRFLKVRVNGNKAKVNVNIPLNLLKAASNLVGFGMKLIPEEARIEMEKKGIDLSKLDIEELVGLIDQGLVDGKLVDVDVDDPEEGRVQVEVYID